MIKNSKSDSYAAAGVDITAGYKAVELMKSILTSLKMRGALMMWADSAVASGLTLKE